MSNSDDIFVRARFDGSNFDANINKSKVALEKFKASTSFEEQKEKASKFASVFVKEIGNIQNSINGFNVKNIDISMEGLSNNLTSGLDKVKSIIENKIHDITSTIQSKIQTIWSGITSEPVYTGFQEYETQINAIQTILANTSSAGTTLDQVKAALNELNHYADLTIYNFTEMTRNIGTFTAAGVDLDTSVRAIKGISNLGAISGSSSEQVSRAMYQLSQALASGKVNLQDWNSVVNSGMGGKVFQDALVETAREMGTVVDLTNQTFRDSLSAKGNIPWLTSDILLATLSKFADETNELGRLGAEAATKVKTITQLWDTVKETVQSGWTQSWTYIIGDFEDARSLLTIVSDKINDILNPIADRRNKMLEYWSTVKVGSDEAVDGLKDTVSASEEIERLAMEVIRGDWANGQERIDLLTQAGYDYTTVQRRVNEILGIVTSANQEIMSTTGMATGREMVLEGLKNITGFLIRMYETAKAAYKEVFPGLTGEKLTELSRKFRDLTKIFELTEIQWNQIHDIFSGLVHILKIVQTAIGHIGTAFKSALNIIDVTELKNSLFELFHIDPNKESKSILKFLSEVGGEIRDFSGGFEADNVKAFFEDVGESIGYCVNYIIDFITAMVDFLNLPTEVKMEALEDAWSHADERLHNLFDTIKDILSPVIEAIDAAFNYICDKLNIDTDLILEKGKEISSGLKNVIDTVKVYLSEKIDNHGLSDNLDSFVSKVEDGAKRIEKSYKEIKQDATEKTTTTTQTTTSSNFDDTIRDTTTAVKDADMSNVKDAFLEKVKSFISTIAGILNVITATLFAREGLMLVHSIRTFTDSFSDMAASIGKGVDAIAAPLKSFASVMYAMSVGIGAASILVIAAAIGVLALSLKMISKIDSDKIEDATMAIIFLFVGLTGALATAGRAGKIIKAGYMSSLTSSIATSVLMMAAALFIISKLNEDQIAQAITVLGVLAAYFKIILSSITKIVAAAGNDVESFKGLGSILTSLALAINMLIIPMVLLGLIPDKILTKGLKSLVAIILVVGVFIAGVGAALGASTKGNSNDIPKIINSLSILLMSLTISINLLMLPISILMLLSKKSPEKELEHAVIGVGLLLAIMVGALYLITKMTKPIATNARAVSKLTAAIRTMSLSIIAITASVLLLIPAIATLTGLQMLSEDAPSKVWGSFAIIFLLLASIVAAMILINKALSNKQARKIKKSMIVTMSLSILAIVGGVVGIMMSMQPLLNYEFEKVFGTTVSIILIILSLMAVVKVLSTIKKLDPLVFATVASIIFGIDLMLYAMRDLKEEKLKTAARIAAATIGVMGLVFALSEIFGKKQINIGNTVNHNRQQLSGMAQIILTMSALIGSVGLMFIGFKEAVDTLVMLDDYETPDITEGIIKVCQAFLTAIPMLSAVLLEIIMAVAGIIKSLPYISWAAEFYAKFMLVVQVMMLLISTGPLIPQFVAFMLQIIVDIVYLLVGFADVIAELIVVLIIAIIDGVGRALQAHGTELGAALANIIIGLAQAVYSLLVSIFGEKITQAILIIAAIAAVGSLLGIATWKLLLGAAIGVAVAWLINSFIDWVGQGVDDSILTVCKIVAAIGIAIIVGLLAGIGLGPVLLAVGIGALIAWLLAEFCGLLGIASPSKVFEDFGVYIIEGLVNGIKKTGEKIWTALKKAAGSAFDKFCKFFEIESPSGLMERMGVFIDMGLANGIAMKSGMVEDSMSELQNGANLFTSNDTAKENGQSMVQSLVDGMLGEKSSLLDASSEIGSSITSGMPNTDFASMLGDTPDIAARGDYVYDISLGESKDIASDIDDINKSFTDFTNLNTNQFDVGGIFGNIQNQFSSGEDLGKQFGLDFSSGAASGFDLGSIFGNAGESTGFFDSIKGMKNSVVGSFTDIGETSGQSMAQATGDGFTIGIEHTATDITNSFSSSGEDSGNGFLSGLLGSGGEGGLVSSIGGLFNFSGEKSGESFLDGITDSFDSKSANDNMTSSIAGLFDNASGEIDATAEVTPILAMGAESDLENDIAAQITAGTVDVSNDARVGIETSGIGEKIDNISIINRQMRSCLMELNSKLATVRDKVNIIQRQNEVIKDNSGIILSNMGHEIYLDSGALVGSIGPFMDQYLGAVAARQNRTNVRR